MMMKNRIKKNRKWKIGNLRKNNLKKQKKNKIVAMKKRKNKKKKFLIKNKKKI